MHLRRDDWCIFLLVSDFPKGDWFVQGLTVIGSKVLPNLETIE